MTKGNSEQKWWWKYPIILKNGKEKKGWGTCEFTCKASRRGLQNGNGIKINILFEIQGFRFHLKRVKLWQNANISKDCM